jgi:hypothetical protein
LAGTGDGRIWRRFDPWTGRFGSPPETPSTAPLPGTDVFAVEPGAFVWLEAGAPARLDAFRYDIRNRYARDIAPLLVTGPDHTAPNQVPSSALNFGPDGLRLTSDSSVVVVSDADYGSCDIEITAGAGDVPIVALGATRLGSECEWPSSEPAADGELFVIRRHGRTAVLERAGAKQSCSVADGRLSVGLSAPAGGISLVRSLAIVRT